MKSFLIVAMALVLCSISYAQEKQHGEQEGMKHSFALKELDVFHDALHPLVHESYPEGDFDTIRAGLENLLDKAKAIEKARLPKKLAGRKKGFLKQSKELVTQLIEMIEIMGVVDDDILGTKFNDMHETFEGLVQLLTE